HAAAEMGASSRCRLFILRISFEGPDTERTIVPGTAGRGGHDRRRKVGGRSKRRVVPGHSLPECRRRRGEQVSGDGAAAGEQPVVVAGGPPDKHVIEHLLNSGGRTAVANEIGAKFTVCGPPEGHIVAQDLDLLTVLDDRRESVVR